MRRVVYEWLFKKKKKTMKAPYLRVRCGRLLTTDRHSTQIGDRVTAKSCGTKARPKEERDVGRRRERKGSTLQSRDRGPGGSPLPETPEVERSVLSTLQFSVCFVSEVWWGNGACTHTILTPKLCPASVTALCSGLDLRKSSVCPLLQDGSWASERIREDLEVC